MSEQYFDEGAMREAICDIGRRIWQREYVAGNDGNISVRLAPNEVLATPTLVSKGFMTPDMMVVLDLEGNVLRGHMRPSTEIKMHRALYNARPDIRAVVHAHPVTATGFAVAGLCLEKQTLPEAVIRLGRVPLAKYGMPGTEKLTADVLENYVHEYDAYLLANHGVTTVGEDLINAYFKMEMVEHYAKISLAARQLGGENQFTPEEIQELIESRSRYDARIGGK